MYEMNFHKTAILSFFNEHKIDKFYNFETLYHNTIPFSNVFEEKNPYLYLNISYWQGFLTYSVNHNIHQLWYQKANTFEINV